jgi:hypothetical protein
MIRTGIGRTLQPPPIHRRRVLLLAFQIHRGLLGIDAHGVPALMAEQILQCQQIAAVTQEVDRERVAKPVNPGIGTRAGARADAEDQQAQAGALRDRAFARGEERISLLGPGRVAR